MFADAGISAVLSGEALDAVHEHAMTILEEIGTDVRHEGARRCWRAWGRTSTASASAGTASS